MLKNKIKTLIDLIEGTEVQEIEVSSFWGAQKIKLNKGSSGNSKPEVIIQKESNVLTDAQTNDSESKATPEKDDSNDLSKDPTDMMKV